ncbi:MAG: DUF512 domain-containing protein [Patescibacteria group bacterium]
MAGDGGRRTLRIAKACDESLGLSFPAAVFDGIRRCGNRCVFCFVDQLPRGMRPTLYVKDEDYRLSFLQGNYVTLSGISAADLARIKSHRLSPLYVSVHATDPGARGRLLGLGGPAPILPLLRELTGAGIKIEAQAVICPGWNDGQILHQTIADLSALWPGVESLAVVPVGLTGHRASLAPLQAFSQAAAAAILAEIESWQERLLGRTGTRFVFAADEFYITAGATMPPGACYEDYLQLENGVGLCRSFEDDFRAAWRRWRAKLRPGRLRVVTGVAASGMWHRLARLMRHAGVSLEIAAVTNRFFGGGVTVAGLLTGGDILAALRDLDTIPTFVPNAAVQRGADVFLDDLTTGELARATGAEVIETDATVFLAKAARALRHG